MCIFQSLLRQCADDIANLLGAIVETDPANPEVRHMYDVYLSYWKKKSASFPGVEN